MDTSTQLSPQKSLKKGNWLPAEDQRLRNGVAKHATRWVLVAGEVITRNGDQCAKRWKEKLNPELDHSPWTSEEETHLLELVDRYGRNWKFMADFFLEARAPLALKNRYALLMRRLKRQGSGSTGSTDVGTFDVPAHAALVLPIPATCVSPIHDVVHTATALIENEISIESILGTSPKISASSSTISFPNGISSSMENVTAEFPPTDTLGPAQATCKSAAIAWDGENVDWQQVILDSMMDLDGVEPIISNPWEGNSASKMAVVSTESTRPSYYSDSSERSSARRSQEDRSSNSDGSSMTSGSKVKFSITCQRGKLKSVVKHMVDAAMAESGELATEEDQVTLTLQLKG
ncbi:hypothetical protein ACN38_g12066 [Penicillium nordicum]|uniref:Myb-like domain-containing protein n=1 Tax=Penicillium nordicum TaxID=229535 RepID=A0A0M8NZ64_9EURO|nr:hypothetical protein ACN38_g12066 [Penicillium nordicum]